MSEEYKIPDKLVSLTIEHVGGLSYRLLEIVHSEGRIRSIKQIGPESTIEVLAGRIREETYRLWFPGGRSYPKRKIETRLF